MTADERALLDAILLAPADDLPRLVYADWLDEHGRPDRAEFIRVQCRMEQLHAAADETLRADLHGSHRVRVGDDDLSRHQMYDLLRPLSARQLALFASRGAEWYGQYACLTGPNVRERQSNGHGRVVRRGFVSEVTGRLRDLRRRMPVVLYRHPVERADATDVNWNPTWYTPGRSVIFWDGEVCSTHGDDRGVLPHALFRRLDGGVCGNGRGTNMVYPNETAARLDLSSALIQEGRDRLRTADPLLIAGWPA